MTLVILFLALQVADWWTTRRFLAAGVKEANPAMAWVIGRFGLTGLLAIKLAIGAAIAWLLYPYPLVLALACAVFAGICVWNYRQVKPNQGD